MFNSIRSKLIVPTIIILVILVVSIASYTIFSTRNLANNLIQERVTSISRISSSWSESMENNSETVAIAVSRSSQLVSSLVEWNAGNEQTRARIRNSLTEYLNINVQEMEISSFAVRDAQGATVLSLHSSG
ncbi:MAG: hypothetical protein FWD01_04775, partial [Defluviitaleaceae bacterium]|nr:hypothetical protein [Defluviitaleaceae bacterium]